MERGTDNYTWNKNDRIGEGAFCVVFKGRNRYTEEAVAIKVCPLSKCTAADARKYIEDIRMLRTFNSPYIIKYFAEEQVKNSTKAKRAIIMELADGSLRTELQKPKNCYGLPKEEFLVLVEHCVKALQYLDRKRLSHRDMKPDNILIFREPTLVFKLCDFGLSQMLSTRDESMHTLLGTLEYMPTSMVKQKAADGEVRYTKDQYDVWATGCCFFEGATGLRPFLPREGVIGKARESEMYELFRKRPNDIACAHFDTEKHKYIYEPELPKQHKSYSGEFRKILSRYFQLMFNKDKKFLNIEKFAVLSRDLVIIKEYRYYCLNTRTEEVFCNTEDSSYFPRKTLLKTIERIAREKYGGLATDYMPEESQNILNLFAHNTRTRKLDRNEYREPFLAAMLPSNFKKRSFSKKLATVYDTPRGLRLEIQGGDEITAFEKRTWDLQVLANQKINRCLLHYLCRYTESEPENPDDMNPPSIRRHEQEKRRESFERPLGFASLGKPPADPNDSRHFYVNESAASIQRRKSSTQDNHSSTSSVYRSFSEPEEPMEVANGGYSSSRGSSSASSPSGPGPSLLISAIESRDQSKVEFLLEVGVPANAVDEDGKPMLCRAAIIGDLEIIKVLVRHGADVQSATEDGWTALHMACKKGHTEIAAFLLTAGADSKAVTSYDETPAMVAERHGRKEIVDLIHAFRASQMAPPDWS